MADLYLSSIDDLPPELMMGSLMPNQHQQVMSNNSMLNSGMTSNPVGMANMNSAMKRGQNSIDLDADLTILPISNKAPRTVEDLESELFFSKGQSASQMHNPSQMSNVNMQSNTSNMMNNLHATNNPAISHMHSLPNNAHVNPNTNPMLSNPMLNANNNNSMMPPNSNPMMGNNPITNSNSSGPSGNPHQHMSSYSGHAHLHMHHGIPMTHHGGVPAGSPSLYSPNYIPPYSPSVPSGMSNYMMPNTYNTPPMNHASPIPSGSHSVMASHNSSVSLMDNLPTEILLYIFSYLNLKEIGRSCQVSSKWNSLCWKSLDYVNLSQTWNFFTRPSAAKYMTENLLRNLFENKFDLSRVTSINAWGCEAFNNKVLETIARNPHAQQNLKSLNIRMTTVNAEGIRFICAFSALEHLTLMSGVGDRDVMNLCNNLPKLQHLLLISSSITDASLSFIGRLHQLRELQLTGCERITDIGISRLSSLQNMRALWLSYTSITDSGLQHLIPLSNLQTLAITNCKITDLGLRYLTLLTNLENLSLSYCYMITGAGVESLTNLPRLVNINLLGCNTPSNKISPSHNAMAL